MEDTHLRLYCGTSGFSFAHWKGPFYPAKLPADEMLAFYAGQLPSVEINNTFYRMPRADVLARWAAQVPESFRFAVKAPRRMSHVKRLADCGDEAARLFGTLEALGPRLGAVLFQLPPHARLDLSTLTTFLELVPRSVRVAFEFRHRSWNDPAVRDVLAARDAASVTTDDDGAPPAELPRTAAWTYLRLRAPAYTPANLRKWRDRCASFERAFVYFKHEDDAAGPAYARQMLGLSTAHEPAEAVQVT